MKKYMQMIAEREDSTSEDVFIDDQFCNNCRWFNPDMFGCKSCRNPACEHCGRIPKSGWCDLWKQRQNSRNTDGRTAYEEWKTYEEEWN